MSLILLYSCQMNFSFENNLNVDRTINVHKRQTLADCESRLPFTHWQKNTTHSSDQCWLNLSGKNWE